MFFIVRLCFRNGSGLCSLRLYGFLLCLGSGLCSLRLYGLLLCLGSGFRSFRLCFLFRSFGSRLCFWCPDRRYSIGLRFYLNGAHGRLITVIALGGVDVSYGAFFLRRAGRLFRGLFRLRRGFGFYRLDGRYSVGFCLYLNGTHGRLVAVIARHALRRVDVSYGTFFRRCGRLFRFRGLNICLCIIFIGDDHSRAASRTHLCAVVQFISAMSAKHIVFPSSGRARAVSIVIINSISSLSRYVKAKTALLCDKSA